MRAKPQPQVRGTTGQKSLSTEGGLRWATERGPSSYCGFLVSGAFWPVSDLINSVFT